MSSSPVVIRAVGVGKRYDVYSKPSHRLLQFFVPRLQRFFGKPQARFGREFWAVRHVDLEVHKGESVGIIGRNGSGKSTLLQLITGVLGPTEGVVETSGRIGALLELGAGFNPEFTGRENALLAGALCGYPVTEAESRIDDVLSFADLGDFIDQPVKVYSSGMFVRLALAVQFTFEPDVLVVDEALSVGDAAFQQKCLARISRMRDDGLTLLFVSHSSEAVRSNCSRALYLEAGRPKRLGAAGDVLDQYLADLRLDASTRSNALEPVSRVPHPSASAAPNLDGKFRYGSGQVSFESVRLMGADEEERLAYVSGEEIRIRATLLAHEDTDNLSFSFLVRDSFGVDVLGTTSFVEGFPLPAVYAGQRFIVTAAFCARLRPAHYGVSVAITRVTAKDFSDNILIEQVDAAVTFEVQQNPAFHVSYKLHVPTQFDVSGVL